MTANQGVVIREIGQASSLSDAVQRSDLGAVQMPVFLRVKDGEIFVDVAILTVAPMTIGRAHDVEVSRPDDISMSSRHASVWLVNRVCHVRDLGSTNGTFLNGEAVSECQVTIGDTLRCGATEFVLELTDADRQLLKPHAPVVGHQHEAGNSPRSTQQLSHSGAAASAVLPPHMMQITGYVEPKAMDVCVRFELQPLLSICPNADELTQEFALRLLNSGAENDCLVFLAYALPKRMGVWWLTRCIRVADSLKSEADPAMLEASEAWVRSPSDDCRRTAMKLAESLEMGTPAAWSGVGAFWSHGSMAPENAPDVPAPDALAGKAISGGAILASVIHSPEKAPERRQQFVELALKISSGELGWTA